MGVDEGHWIRQHAVAHRGYHSGREIPENSLLSFDLAIERNLPIEMDVRVLGDGTPVIYHDLGTKRLSGVDRMLKDLKDDNRGEFQLLDSKETMPSFKEVLNHINGRVPILLEIKSDNRSGDVERGVYHCLDSYKGELAIQSFNPWTVGWFRQNRPDLKRGFLGMAPKHYGTYFVMNQVLGNLLHSVHVAPDFYGYDKSDVARLPVQFWKRSMNAPLLAWTVKSQEDRDFVAPYVDNIIFENLDIKY